MNSDVAMWGAGILLALLGAVCKWAWDHTHEKIDGKADKNVAETLARIEDDLGCLRRKLEDKASNDEVNRQRGHVEKLYAGQQHLADTMATGFAQVNERMHANTLMVLEKITEMSYGRKN